MKTILHRLWLALLFVAVFVAGATADRALQSPAAHERTVPFTAVKIGVLKNVVPQNGVSIAAWDHNCVSHFAILTQEGFVVILRDEGPDSKPCVPPIRSEAH